MYKYIFLFPLLIISINTSFGETISDVNVSSPIYTNSIDENKYPIHIVNNEEINTYQSIGENLKNYSGISNADYGTAVGQPVIRGLTGNRTRILTNGIQLNDLTHISSDHANNVGLNNI